MTDLAELTLSIKSEQAAKATSELAAMERASQSAERAAESLTRTHEKSERAAVGLERTYRRVRDELSVLTAAEVALDRQAQQSVTSVLNLGSSVAAASEEFSRFGTVDLLPLREELEAAEERLALLQEQALASGGKLGELDNTSLTELETEIGRVQAAFAALEDRAVESSAQLQREAQAIIRAYNTVGQRISQPFESGVELSFTERVGKVEQEVSRRRDLISAVSAQLSELDRLGDVEQAEIARASELTSRYEQQSLARLRDAEAARAQAEASRPRLSAQFEAGVDLSATERIGQVEAEALRRRSLISVIEAQLSSSGKLGVEQQSELSRARDLTTRFEQQALARIRDEQAGNRQVQANNALGHSSRELLHHVKGLALAYLSFVGIHEAAEAVLEFGHAESSLRGLVAETTRGLEGQTAVFGKLSKEAKEIGLTTQFTGAQAETGFNQFIQSGQDAESAILGVRAAMALAEAQAIPLGQSVDIVSRALRQYQADGSLATRITDSFVNVAIRTQGDVQQLAFNFQQVGPSARAAGFELEEVVATLGALSQLRGRGQQAPLVFKEFVDSLINPSKEAKIALEEIGLSMEQLNPRTNSLLSILETLRSKNLDSAQASRIFGDSVAFSIPFLVQQTDAIGELVKVQREGIGVTERLAEANSDNLKGSLEELRAAFVTVIGSSQGVAGSLQHLVDEATDVVRVLGSADGQMRDVSDGAQAFADALRAVFSPIGLVIGGVAALSGAWRAYQVAVLGAKFETIGLFGLLSAHPFVAIASALGLLTAAFLIFRDRAKSAREEMKELGAAFDFEIVDRFTDSIDRLSAAFAKARVAQDLTRQLDTVRALHSSFLQSAEELRGTAQKDGEEPRIPILAPEGGVSLRQRLARLEGELDLEIPVHLRLDEAIDAESEELRDRVSRNLVDAVKQAEGEIKVNLRDQSEPFPILTRGRGLESKESLVRRLVPAGAFELEALSPRKVDQFLGSINDLAAKTKAALQDGLTVDEEKALQSFARAASDELLKGEEVLSIRASRLEPVFDSFTSGLEDKQRALRQQEAQRTKLAQDAVAGTGAGLSESQSDARQELERLLLTKRAELAQLEATQNALGETAQRYGELAEYQRLLGDAGLDTSEKQKKFREETERLQALLRDGFRAPDKLEAFSGEFSKLLLRIEEFKRAQAGLGSTKDTPQAEGQRVAPLTQVTAQARLLEADAVLGQDEATKRFLTTLRVERKEIEQKISLTQADVETVLSLSRAERLLSDSTQLSSSSRQEYLGLVKEEVTRLRTVRDAQAATQRERGEERRAIDDSVDARLYELDVYASGKRPIQEFTASLEKERQAREQAVGLTEEEALALRQLATLERVLASVVDLTADKREAGITSARAELRAQLELTRAKEVAASAQADRTIDREQVAQALRAQQEENNRIQDGIDLLNAKTEAERDEIVLASARRGLSDSRKGDVASLEELIGKLEEALRANRRLRGELDQQTQRKSQLTQAVLGADEQRSRLEDETKLINAKTEAERRTIVLERLQRVEQLSASDLQTKSLEELRDLYIELSKAIEAASDANVLASAQQDLRAEIKALKSSPEDREVNQRLRGIPEERLGDKADEIRGLVRQANAIRDFQEVGRAIARSFTDAFDAILFQGAKLEDVLSGIARRVLSSFLEVFAFRPFENFLSGLFGGLGGAATGGGGFELPGTLIGAPKALGDVFGAPKPYAAGAAFGLRDERQTVLPLARGAMIYGDEPGMAVRASYQFARGGVLAHAPEEPVGRARVLPFARGGTFTFEHPNVDTTPSIGAAALAAATDPESAVAYARGGVLAALNASAPDAAPAVPFARGNPFINRIVSKATLAPLALFGEAGPEAIVPLRARGGQLGISAFGQGREELAPLQRGAGGRLGIDLDKLLSRVDREDLPTRGFALGSAFGDELPQSASQLAGFSAQPDFQRSVSAPFAVVPPASQGSVDNSSSESAVFNYSPTNHYHFGPGVTPDQGFKRSARQQERDMEDKTRNVFKRR